MPSRAGRRLGRAQGQAPHHPVTIRHAGKIGQHLARGHGLAEQVALALIATLGGYPRGVERALDALRGHAEIEARTHREDRLDDLHAVNIRAHGRDEGAIDLDFLELQFAQMIEARIAVP